MCRLSYCTLVLIVASCYIAVSSNAKAVQGAQKLDLTNRINDAASAGGSAAAAARRAHSIGNTEARRKRAMGEYKGLNELIDELEENSLMAQKAMGAAAGAGGAPNAAGGTLSQPGAAAQSQEFDLDNIPPLTYYLLLQKLRQLQSSEEPTPYRVRTPRLGRSIDFQQLLDASSRGGSVRGNEDEDGGGGAGNGFSVGGAASTGISRQFVSRMMKKSVPFKPRLGKRAQVCGD